MADFPSQLLHLPAATTINTAGLYCGAADMMVMNSTVGAAAVWPSANRAIYVPVIVESYVTAYQMAFEVTTQSGNYDVGIYDELGNRVVSKGTTAVPVAGIATADITDTPLTPGVYFLAMAIDNGTAAVWRHSSATAGALSVAGVQDQDTAFVLPNPAVFSAPATNYYPLLAAAVRPTL